MTFGILLFCIASCLVCTPDSYRYSYSSWRGPKHVEVINKTDEIYWGYCAPGWFHLPDYVEMHGQQNIKKKKVYSVYNMMNDMIWISQIHPKSNVFVHVQDIYIYTLKLKWWQCICVHTLMIEILSVSCEAIIHTERGT